MGAQGQWRTVEVKGKPCDVYEPEGAEPARGVILFLHGLAERTLLNHRVATEWLMRHRLVAICPRTGRSWWTNRIVAAFDPVLTTEGFLLDGVLPDLESRWDLRPPVLALLGVSMGGQGALRFAFKYPRLFRSVAALAATIDYHELHGQGTPLDSLYPDRETARQDSVALHVHPLNYPPHIFLAVDPLDADWAPGNYRLHEKLSALGIPHRVDFETTGGEHSWIYFDRLLPSALDFLAQGIEVERSKFV